MEARRPWGHGPANIGGAGGDRPADILIHFVGILIPLEGDMTMKPVSPRVGGTPGGNPRVPRRTAVLSLFRVRRTGSVDHPALL